MSPLDFCPNTCSIEKINHAAEEKRSAGLALNSALVVVGIQAIRPCKKSAKFYEYHW